MSLKVIKGGLFTTIQDIGRFGYQSYGVVVSGAMDNSSCRIANFLVGNSDHALVLEITLNGPTLEWQADTCFSICGANLSPTIDGEAVPLWRPIYVKKGSVLRFHNATEGCRAYLAIAGGIKLPSVLGSGSTDVRGALGGFEGRALREGDIIPFEAPSYRLPFMQKSKKFITAPWFISGDMLPQHSTCPTIRFIRGQEYKLFGEESHNALVQTNFKIDPQSNRMGCKLSGYQLSLLEPYEMISETVTAGTIQVPPEGHPIILLSDRQTTGGYPRIAQVASVDLPLIAQLKPGESLHFEEITHQEAERLYIQKEQDMEILKQGILLKRMR